MNHVYAILPGVVLLVTLGGCSEAPVSVPDAAMVDADVDDSARPEQDVGTSDANLQDAAVHDAGNDAASSDAMASVDEGAAVDAGEPCTAPGMYRVVGCACGGHLSERCVDGSWTEVSACDATPECAPGSFELTEPNLYCSVDQRVCGDDCAWGAWTQVVPRGECAAHTSQCVPLAGINCDCQTDCTCQPVPGCPG